MDKFEEFIVKKYPNRSAKVLLHKLQDNDGTWFYAVKEVQDQSEAWQSRQPELVDKDQRIHELNETSLDLEGQIYKLQEQLNEKDKRIADLELALTQIKSWESHPKNYGIDFGSWGLRDFYRDLADKALRGEHE